MLRILPKPRASHSFQPPAAVLPCHRSYIGNGRRGLATASGFLDGLVRQTRLASVNEGKDRRLDLAKHLSQSVSAIHWIGRDRGLRVLLAPCSAILTDREAFLAARPDFKVTMTSIAAGLRVSYQDPSYDTDDAEAIAMCLIDQASAA